MTSRAEDLVRGHIHKSGPISFETFMEVALYSDVGYYRNKDIFGLRGDYYTSPHLHPIFGAMFALQIERMWEIMGSPANLYVIEQGGGDGTLAVDISTAVSSLNVSLYESLKYVCVDRQKIEIEDSFRIQFAESEHISIEDQTCIILSNELVDSFPVRMIEIIDKEIFEVFVDLDDKGDFIESLMPLNVSELAGFLPRDIQNLDGYRGPINTKTREWYSNLSNVMKKGFMITIDYGFEKDLYYSMQKSHRLLQTYYRHTEGSSPYQRIGSQDLTAHVNFDSLREIGLSNGFEEIEYLSQSEWLDSMGLANILQQLRVGPDKNRAMVNLISTLQDPSGLGGFKVLIQGKNLGNIDLERLNSDISWPLDLRFPNVREVHMAYSRERGSAYNLNFF